MLTVGTTSDPNNRITGMTGYVPPIPSLTFVTEGHKLDFVRDAEERFIVNNHPACRSTLKGIAFMNLVVGGAWCVAEIVNEMNFPLRLFAAVFLGLSWVLALKSGFRFSELRIDRSSRMIEVFQGRPWNPYSQVLLQRSFDDVEYSSFQRINFDPDNEGDVCLTWTLSHIAPNGLSRWSAMLKTMYAVFPPGAKRRQYEVYRQLYAFLKECDFGPHNWMLEVEPEVSK